MKPPHFEEVKKEELELFKKRFLPLKVKVRILTI